MGVIDWPAALTQAVANIPTAIITGTALFWATHINKKLVDQLERKHPSRDKDTD